MKRDVSIDISAVKLLIPVEEAARILSDALYDQLLRSGELNELAREMKKQEMEPGLLRQAAAI